jgi:hypothetical protein
MACVSSPFRCRHRIRNEFSIFLSLAYAEDHDAGGFSGSGWSGSSRAHRPGFEEFLEEWYDRSAQTCDRFENTSEVDKYCVTCTVCRHFKDERCSLDPGDHTIVSLLNACHAHDD